MILKADIDGVASYDVGDEIWQVPMSDAIHAEAECIVYSAGSDLLASGHDQLRARIVAEMSEALSQVGDTYRAPDGVRYSLIEPSAVEDDGTLTAVSSAAPVVEEVLRFEKTFRSVRSARAARLSAGATAPRAKDSSGSGTRS